MLCGKSTVGKKLAKRLNLEFVDTDKLIESKYRLCVEQIFSKYGETVFRLFEKEILEDLIKKDNIVVATGGGMPCFGENLKTMKSNGIVIYLNMNPISIVSRHKKSHRPRPLLKGKNDEELLEYIKQNLKKRDFYYQQADLILKAESINIEEIISKISSTRFF
jgi:shikimate kinase